MRVHDFIAVGLGPFNLGLACLTAPLKDISALFLERNASFAWHPGMLVARCTLQNPFLADLVSLADPTSRFSYLNYCKQEGRLYACYVREDFYLTRQAYNRYCQWAAARLDSVRFGHEVLDIARDEAAGVYLVRGHERPSGRPFEFAAKRLVLGVGWAPRLPEGCDPGGPQVHSADYLRHKPRLQAARAITLVGSGQSGAEIFHDLLQDMERHTYTLQWITRASRFFQMETGKLALELISPDYIEHFFDLPPEKKAALLREQKSLYNGINLRLVNAIYDALDEGRDALRERVRLLPGLALEACRFDAASGRHILHVLHTELDRRYRHETEAVVLATGYVPRVPPFIAGIRHRIAWEADGRYRQARNYAVDHAGTEIFVQNAGLHSHGLSNPDLGMSAYRNAVLIRALTGVEHYRIERRTALQDFAPPRGSAFVELA